MEAEPETTGRTARLKKKMQEIREKPNFYVMVLKGGILLQLFARFAFLLLPIGFFLGAGGWRPWAVAVSYNAIFGASWLFFATFWFWAKFGKDEMLKNIAGGAMTEQERQFAKGTKGMENERSFSLLMIFISLDYVINTVSQWAWINRFVTQGGAPNQESNTPNPGTQEYWRFYLAEGIMFFTQSMALIIFTVFFLRLSDLQVKTGAQSAETPFKPFGGYCISGHFLYALGFGYSFVYFVAFLGTNENINMTGLFSVLVPMWVAFLIHALRYWMEGARNLGSDLYFRTVAQLLFWLFFLAYNSIFASYVVTNHRQVVYRDGKIPTFDNALAGTGQHAYFYLWVMSAIINSACLPTISAYWGSHWFSCYKGPIEYGQGELTDIKRRWLAYAVKYSWLAVILVVFGFVAFDAWNTFFLNNHFKNWTIYASLAVGIFAVFVVISALLLYISESRHLVTTQFLFPTIMVIIYTGVFAIQFIWTNVYYEVAYSTLGHSSSETAIKDLSNRLSVYWWAYPHFIMLICIPATLAASDFLSHTMYMLGGGGDYQKVHEI